MAEPSSAYRLPHIPHRATVEEVSDGFKACCSACRFAVLSRSRSIAERDAARHAEERAKPETEARGG